MVNDSSSSLSESKFDYGVDGYLFEAKRSDDVTVVHFICAGDDINFKETGFGRLDLLVGRLRFHYDTDNEYENDN